VEWAQAIPTSARQIGGVGLGSSLVEPSHDDRVEANVDLLDPLNMRVDSFSRGDLACPNQADQLGGAPSRESLLGTHGTYYLSFVECF